MAGAPHARFGVTGLSAALGLALAFLCASHARAEVRRFALVIGNNLPANDEGEALRYADDDAVASHRLFLDAAVESRLLVRLDGDSATMYAGLAVAGPPRVAEVERALSQLLARMRLAEARGATTEFLFFYSGHGDVEEGEGFVALEDGRLTRSGLFDLLARTGAARNHVFVDACRSYFLAYDRGPGGRRRAAAGHFAARVPARLDNTGFVLSTSSDRESHEWDRYQGGVMSHELRSALRGAADANLDARIDYREVGAFLRVANQAIANPGLRPEFLVRAPAGDPSSVVLQWEGEAPLSIESHFVGHFYVEDALGERLLDAHPAPEQALRLWMPAMRPLFVRQADGFAELRIDSADHQRVKTLSRRPTGLQARGAVILAFDRLFAVPFGETDVQRFMLADTGEDLPTGEPRVHRAVRIGSGLLALAATTSGVVLNGLAHAAFRRSEGKVGTEIEKANRYAIRANKIAAGCYALGAAATTAFVWTTVRKRRAGFAIGVTVGQRAMLVAHGRF